MDGLALDARVRQVSSWAEAGEICRRPAEAWWRVEEAERERLEKSARLNPADRAWLALNEVLHGAAAVAAARSGCADAALIRAAAGAAGYAAYQARLARAAGGAPSHPFLRKYALYCGGRWPLGVYQEQFAIF